MPPKKDTEPTTESAAQLKNDIPNYGMKDNKKEGHVGNKNYGVGGTDKDGGLSTADTVADGGPDDEEEDGEFKP
ncbi:hypothetical protein PRZ48_003722 [Zasmidium cellare]|uniref:Uncharacterized protein n=1 Tax=Zasmidium cellare TaxID=395010 RepID=A0ABR0EVV1_ZASCE|nr:hypothetical protein PRZ48_003722 [Zasmidium cellare]